VQLPLVMIMFVTCNQIYGLVCHIHHLIGSEPVCQYRTH